MAGKSKPNELEIIRLYDAPVKAVWDAWTDPAQAAQWWGPRGFTITTHSKDLRPGGIWHYTMHGPDGTVYPNKTKYLAVEKHKKLVYDHGGFDDRAPLFRVEVDFEAHGDKTKMCMVMSLPTAEAARATKEFIKKAGGNGTWDRLAEFVEKEKSGKEKFVINRSFEAPIATLFDLWADPRQFSRWIAPSGMNMEFLRAEIKTGGSTFYYMAPEGGGPRMYGRAEYLEIKKPERLVYTQQFCDENEKPVRHPMAPSWPDTILTTVTFTAEGSTQTRVTVEWEPAGSVSAEELKAFVEMKPGMTQGWTGSFDKLEALLE